MAGIGERDSSEDMSQNHTPGPDEAAVKKPTRAQRFARWLADQVRPRVPRSHYGQNVVVRVPTPMLGKLYKPNGAKECARRRRQRGLV